MGLDNAPGLSVCLYSLSVCFAACRLGFKACCSTSMTDHGENDPTPCWLGHHGLSVTILSCRGNFKPTMHFHVLFPKTLQLLQPSLESFVGSVVGSAPVEQPH